MVALPSSMPIGQRLPTTVCMKWKTAMNIAFELSQEQAGIQEGKEKGLPLPPRSRAVERSTDRTASTAATMQPHRNDRRPRIKFLLSRDFDASFDPQEATSQSLLHLLLPEELLHHVFSFLDWPALCRCASVSHLWRRLSFAVEHWRLQQQAAIASRKRRTYEAEEEEAKKNVPMASSYKAWKDGLDARNRRTHYLMKMLRAEAGEEEAMDGAKYFSVEGMMIRRPFAFYDYVVRPYFQQQRQQWMLNRDTKNQQETEEEEEEQEEEEQEEEEEEEQEEERKNVNKITRGVMKGWLKALRLPKALEEKLRLAPPKDAFKALSERVIWEEQVEDAREGMLDYHECVEQGLVAAGQQQRKRRRRTMKRQDDGKQEGHGQQGMEEQDAQGRIEWMDEMFYCFVQGEDEQWFDYEQVDNDERWDPPEVDLDIGDCCPYGCCNWAEM
ncbi:hypothetical protein QOT17_009833 [Balamuthia mandrillaris]